MASAYEYAAWIVDNADKKGTPEFQTVADAYAIAKAEEGIVPSSPERPTQYQAPQQEPTLGEKAVGALETAATLATGATGGAIGQIGGTIGGMAENIAGGTFGTQQGAELVKQRAAQGAAAMTLAPKSSTGQSYTEAAAEFLTPLTALMPATAELGAIGQAARNVSQAAKPIAKVAAQKIIPKKDIISGINLTGGRQGSYAVDKQYGRKIANKVNEIGGEFSLKGRNDILDTIKSQTQSKTLTDNDYGQLSTAIFNSAKKHDVDPTVLTAQILHETGNLKNAKGNNFGGITWNEKMGLAKRGRPRPANEGGYYVKSASIAEGVEKQAQTLAKFKTFKGEKAQLTLETLDEQALQAAKELGLSEEDIQSLIAAKKPTIKEKIAPVETPLSTSEQLVAASKQQQALDLPTPIELTRGQATRKFAEQQFERETAKQPELGAPLRQRYEQQNAAIIHNLDSFIESSGAKAQTSLGAGQKVSDTLANLLNKEKTKVRTLYKEAEKSGEMNIPIESKQLVDYLNNTVAEATNAAVLKVARAKAISLGIAKEDKSGNLIATPTPLKNISELRKSVGNSSSTPTDFYHAAQIKNIVDESMSNVGGKMLQKAIEARKEMGNTFEKVGIVKDITGYKKGTTDRKIATEKIFNRSILSANVADINKLKNTLLLDKKDGVQSWKELQGATLRHILEKSTDSVTTGENRINVVSAYKLNKVISDLDKNGKLELIFGKKQANDLRLLNDIAKDILTSVPGAVNSSNTAAVLLAAIDGAMSGTIGVPAPIMTSIRMIVNKIKDGKIKTRVNRNLSRVTIQKGQK